MATVLIDNILGAEITAIPSWIRTIFKGYYNNTLCNGVTWMLVLWKVFHIIYTRLAHRCLSRIRTKQYIRSRLTNSLWYCIFFSSVLAYCLVNFDGKKMDLLRGTHVTSTDNLPMQVILAYTAICTFYLHTALFEGIQSGSVHLFLKYFLLVAVCTSAYILRLLTVPFTLSALIATTAISEELTKIFCSVLKHDKFVGSLYFVNLMLFTFIYLIIIPLILLIPLGKMITSNNNDAILILLFSSLLSWLCLAMYRSIITNSILHWIYHTNEEPKQEEKQEEEEDEEEKITVRCPGSIIECSLFSTRTDDAYILNTLRSQIEKRKTEMDNKKKPKTKNMMLIQTLKCMMAIRKKLNEKKKSESSDSDEPSEKDGNTEDGKVGAEKEFEDNCTPKLEIEEMKDSNIEDEQEDKSTHASVDLQNVLTNEPNFETARPSEFNLKNSQNNDACKSSCNSETKVDIAESAKDNTDVKIDSGFSSQAGKLENIESGSGFVCDAGNLVDFKSYSDILCKTGNLENVESGQLLPDTNKKPLKIISDFVCDAGNLADCKSSKSDFVCETGNLETVTFGELLPETDPLKIVSDILDELLPETDKKPLKIVSDILDDIVDNKLNVETEMTETKLDETSVLLDEQRNKEADEVHERKSKVKILTSFRKSADGDD